jgi:hypothetical protein
MLTNETFTEANLRTITDSAGNTSVVRTTNGYIPTLRQYGVEYTGQTQSLDSNTNIFTYPVASLGFDEFNKWSEVIFDKREQDMALGMCGYGFLTNIASKCVNNSKKMGFLGQVQLGDTRINSLGFNIRELVTTSGIIQLAPMKSLRDVDRNVCLLPNTSAIGIMEYEPFQYLADIKKDDNYTGIKDVYNYDAGLWMTTLETQQMISLTE